MNNEDQKIESTEQQVSSAESDEDGFEIVTVVKSCAYDPLTRL